MKTFTFKLERTSVKKVFTDLRRAVKTGIPDIREDEMACGTIEAMMTIISRSKFEAFAAIVEHKPQTLKELAEILGKNLGNISRDVKVLELLGLIELKRESGGNKTRPIAKYDQIKFDFSHSIGKASGN
jgi:predicted transcriptional regulator